MLGLNSLYRVPMFVRRTQTRRTQNGQIYFSHRLVRSERIGAKVRQRTLLNLGRHFDIPQADWPRLCVRIEELLAGQYALIPDDSAALEQEAQRIAALLIAREADLSGPAPETRTVTVEVDSLELTRPRSVGVEQAGLWAMDRLGLRELFQRLGINGPLRAAAAGSIIGRLAAPASGLGELLGVDFETMGAMQLYRASDALMAHPLFENKGLTPKVRQAARGGRHVPVAVEDCRRDASANAPLFPVAGAVQAGGDFSRAVRPHPRELLASGDPCEKA